MTEKANITLEIRKSKKYGRGDYWIIDVCPYADALDACYGYITVDGLRGDYCDYLYKSGALDAAKLTGFPIKDEPDTSAGEVEIRKFSTGATRDTVDDKLSYVKALSPIVLQRYVQYLDSHRKQPDGSMRDFDNWKKGIPQDVYLDGLGRHFVATWLLAQGFPAEDNHGPVTLEDSLCALIFGASGWLYELLKAKTDI